MNVPSDIALSALAREVGVQLHRVVAPARRPPNPARAAGSPSSVTDIAGSSDWFDCGFVCYSNAAKTRDLGVPEKLIESDGAVSDEVVRAMAEGAIERTGATWRWP